MFDFIRKRLNKTIKDAEETIPDEEIEEQKQLDGETIDKQEDQEEDNTTEEQEITDESEEDKKEKQGSRFSFFKRNKDENKEEQKDQDNQEESEEEPKTTDENIEESLENKTETTSDDLTEDSKNEEQEKESKKEEKSSRFSFFKRNKDEDKEEQKEDKTSETEEETIEESKNQEDEQSEENEEENESSSRFNIFSKNDKDEEEKSEEESEEEESSGRFSFITKKTIKENDIEDILYELEISLLEGDVALEVAETIVESVKNDLIGKKISRRGDMEKFTEDALKSAITKIIDNGSYDLLSEIEKSKQKGEPYKIMFVGINGTGKTTTIAKIAKYLEKNGYSSVFGASDTFRAGAIEQLEHHANNLNMKIIKHERNADPAAVAYDAVDHAKSQHKDVVLIDTSGRMQTNINLMDEMKKIKRVSKPDIVLYVGDALMGNDATEQATKFNEVIDIDGIILTKADADAKGGAALSIGHVIHKPILFIGMGQSYDDLMEFKPSWMIDLIFNDEEEEVTA